MKAYFAYINARKGPDGKRGVMGRQIIWKYYDDGYNPANTAQLTRRLVEQDKVFATVGQLGTEPVLAVTGLHEPAEGSAGTRLHRGLRTGAPSTRSSRGRSAGSPTTSRRAASTACTSRRTIAGKKIAIVYQNDDYGKDYLYGFRAALGKSYADANVVAQEAVEATATSVAAQMTRIRASGAQVLAVFQLPRPTQSRRSRPARLSASTPSRST